MPSRAAVEAEGAVEGQTEQVGAWWDLCGALLMLAGSHAIECEFLRERLERAEKEEEVFERTAEELYRFFHDMARRAVNPGDDRLPVDPPRGQKATGGDPGKAAVPRGFGRTSIPAQNLKRHRSVHRPFGSCQRPGRARVRTITAWPRTAVIAEDRTPNATHLQIEATTKPDVLKP